MLHFFAQWKKNAEIINDCNDNNCWKNLQAIKCFNFLKLPVQDWMHIRFVPLLKLTSFRQVCLPEIGHMAHMLLKIQIVNIRSLLDNWRNKVTFPVYSDLLTKSLTVL